MGAFIRATLLGEFGVTVDGQRMPVPPLRQRMLLALLLAEAPRRVPAPLLIQELWDNRRPGNERAALHIHMTRLRRLLAWTDPRLTDVIRTENDSYRLVCGGLYVDLAAYHSAYASAQASRRGGDAAAERRHIEEAIALWRGDLLEDLPTGRVYTARRRQLQEYNLDLTERLHELQIRAGEYTSAVRSLRRIVAAHPLRESAWFLLMKALEADGRGAEAVAAFSTAREVFATELGVEPGTQLRSLFQTLLAA
ncbi:AfsR/SARP family transcriptional regulator [Actinacidiphila sp. ITFR-21]|uniref:AfsR/SARP family transcriptional regulator n=1 Tax=Actinacidiphila sp. ITFR-21 TaxID=3075199 RepID=UPI00288AA5A4|nr:BTAD domain-containing putative transcriptional regulator [Streptomyces sp. ITFR-21]WNI18814.1 BTAD domain-containing putative transcriptional regulator [Streptomyces sp. ITFR-21]